MNRADDRPFDVGLQAERTALAWTRTALALLATAVLVARLGAAELGSVTWLLVLVGAAVTAVVLFVSGRRYRALHSALHTGAPLPDALLPTALAALATAATLTELTAILTP